MKWFVGAILLLVVALIFDLSLLTYAMYALLGLMVVSRLLARAWSENLESQRQCDKLTANVGDTVTILIKIANRSKLPIAWVLIEDLLPPKALITDPPSLDVQGERIQLMRVRGNQQKTIRYRMECNRRGYFQIGPLVLETGDLFGLHRRYRVMNEPNFLLVYPQIVPLEGYEIASRRPIGEVTARPGLFVRDRRGELVRWPVEGFEHAV